MNEYIGSLRSVVPSRMGCSPLPGSAEMFHFQRGPGQRLLDCSSHHQVITPSRAGRQDLANGHVRCDLLYFDIQRPNS